MSPRSKDDEQEFLELQAKWDKKLKKSGFNDIEQRNDGNLKVSSQRIIRAQENATAHQAKVDYYRLAGQFLWEYPFKRGLDKFIWSLHAEGVSLRDISDEIKKKKHKTMTKNKVHEVVKRLEDEMIAKCRK